MEMGFDLFANNCIVNNNLIGSEGNAIKPQ